MTGSPSSTGHGTQVLRTNQIIVAAMTFAVVVAVPVVCFVALGLGEQPDFLWLALPAVIGVVAAAACATVGFQVAPLDPGRKDVERAALAAFPASTLLRSALAEMPGLVGLVSAFVAGSALPVVVGAGISLVLMALFAWPSGPTIARLERRLDAKGARSRLSENLLGTSSGAVTYH